MVATRRSASPSLSEGSTVSVTTASGHPGKKVGLAHETIMAGTESSASTSSFSVTERRKNWSKPPKKIVKGTGHIHFYKRAPTVTKKGSGTDDGPEVQRVKLRTGTLYIIKGRKAEFVRTK